MLASEWIKESRKDTAAYTQLFMLLQQAKHAVGLSSSSRVSFETILNEKIVLSIQITLFLHVPFL